MSIKKIFFLNRNNSIIKAAYGIIVISFFISFFYAFITPLDIVLNNQEDFWLPFFEIANCMIFPAVSLFLAFLFISFLILKINRKMLLFFQMILVGLYTASYFQELCMNGKMVRGENGVIVGTITDFEKGINLFIFFSIIFIPVGIIFYLKNNNNNKYDGEYYQIAGHRIIIVTTIIITMMKLSGFISSYIAHDPIRHQTSHGFYDETYLASYEPTTSFSQENNIYVFIIDRFDTFWCDEFLKSYPEMKNELDGFTFYQNNVSHYINTFPSITSFLTHTVYDNTDYSEFWETAWSKKNAFTVLKENDYSVNFIIDRASTYGRQSNILSVADNMQKLDDENLIVDRNKLRKILYGLMFSRLMPYDFKGCFDYAVNDLANARYIKFNYLNSSPEVIGCDSDNMLYEYIKKASFNADSVKKNITVIHLNGAHDPNETLIEKTRIEPSDDVIISTIRANFETINHYIEEAKKLNVYDKTTFIIFGDHGYSPGEKINGRMTMVRPNVNGLLIKTAGEEHGELKYDAISCLSNDMFSASILEYAGVDHSEYGYSYQDAIKTGEMIPRIFSADIWGSAIPKNPGNDETYIINGNARDFNNWEKMNNND